jgi:hypothetical protein
MNKISVTTNTEKSRDWSFSGNVTLNMEDVSRYLNSLLYDPNVEKIEIKIEREKR